MHLFLKKVAKKFGGMKKMPYLCTRKQAMRALSSVGSERLPYKQRVGGSNPSAPTPPFIESCDMTFVVLQDFFIIKFTPKWKFIEKMLGNSKIMITFVPELRKHTYFIN